MEMSVHHHLGLGDHFDMNGMIRYFLETYASKVYVYSKSNYFSMVKYMYRDEPNIVVVEIDKDFNELLQVKEFVDKNPNLHHVRIGFENYPSPFTQSLDREKNCWEYFYEQVDVPYRVRNNYFHVARDLEKEEALLKELNPHNVPFAFVHDDPDRGFNISNTSGGISLGMHVIRNDTSKNIFHYLTILEEAEEIHCMESSFKTLIDLYSVEPDLFFHSFRGHPLGERTNRIWTVVDYE
jgi:hypothetical protein